MRRAYYKIENGKVAVGNKSHGAEWKEYIVGQEPQELKQILDTEKNSQAIKDANDEIYAKLDEIDRKSVRAIRENNQERMTALENEAIALRSQLQSI